MTSQECKKVLEELKQLMLETEWGGVPVTKGAFREALSYALNLIAKYKLRVKELEGQVDVEKSKRAVKGAINQAEIETLKKELSALRGKVDVGKIERLLPTILEKANCYPIPKSLGYWLVGRENFNKLAQSLAEYFEEGGND